MSKGLSDNPYYEVPLASIKLPSEDEISILSFIKKYEGSLHSIKTFVKMYVMEIENKEVDDPEVLNKCRARLNYHLTNLEKLMVIKRQRTGKKVSLRLIELGNVFVD